MIALAYLGPGRLELVQRPRPQPSEGEVLLQVEACSICGTDLRIASGAHPAYSDGCGRVPGHEIVGTVVESCAPGAPQPGTRVFVMPNYGCTHCRACERGLVNLCANSRAVGITDDGGFAEYLLLRHDLVAQGNLLPVGHAVDPVVVTLVEPLACVLRGSQACKVRPGDLVVVFGAGPVGLLHVALARLAGASRVVVSSRNPGRRQRALSFGATEAVGVKLDQLNEAVGREGADVVIVAAPSASAQEEALRVAGCRARVNFFAGLPRGTTVPLDTNLVHYKELLVTGTTASTSESCREALGLISSKEVDAAALVDARLPLASAAEAFELARSGSAMKVVLQP